MKIPKKWYKFRVGDIVCNVSRKKQRVALNGREAGGFYDPSTGEIWVTPDAGNEELRMYFHEFLHACFDDMGLAQTSFWTGDLEEMFCEKLGRYLANLHENKK